MDGLRDVDAVGGRGIERTAMGRGIVGGSIVDWGFKTMYVGAVCWTSRALVDILSTKLATFGLPFTDVASCGYQPYDHAHSKIVWHGLFCTRRTDAYLGY